MEKLFYIFVCLITLNIFAAPGGVIICAFNMNSTAVVCSVNVVTEEKQILASYGDGCSSYAGVCAPPFLGDPCVTRDAENLTISLLAFNGAMNSIVPVAAAGVNLYPCYSFDGTKIAYVQRNVSVSNEDILHVVNSDGSSDTSVYTTPLWGVNIGHPAYSPDGSTLAFALDDSHYGSRDIYTMSVGGGVPQELEDLPEDAMQPAFSPDGTKLACVSEHGGSTYHLFIANADGSNPQQITSGGAFAFFPSFSPDGRYIAVASDNGILIIDLSNNQEVKEIPLDYDSYKGLVWCLGAQKSEGNILKAKVKEKSVSLKLQNMQLGVAPNYGIVQIDKTAFVLSDTNLWSNKKDKKYIYKDKANKLSAKITVKNKKVKFSAKKLSLTEGSDYTLNTNVPVVVNFGNETVVETIQLDAKGKYKAPR